MPFLSGQGCCSGLQSHSTTGALPGLPPHSAWRCCSASTSPCSHGMLVSFHTPSIFLQSWRRSKLG